MPTIILFGYILLEFLYFSWLIVTRIAKLLGIRVFRSGKKRVDPVEDFLSKTDKKVELVSPFADPGHKDEEAIQLKDIK